MACALAMPLRGRGQSPGSPRCGTAPPGRLGRQQPERRGRRRTRPEPELGQRLGLFYQYAEFVVSGSAERALQHGLGAPFILCTSLTKESSPFAAPGLGESEPFGQARTDDRYAVLSVESLHGVVVARRGDPLELTEVSVEADPRRQQVDYLADTLVGQRVREAVRDAGRSRGEVARSKLDDILAQLGCQYAFQDVERIFLCGVDVQGWAGPKGEVVYNEKVEAPLVVTTVRFPRPPRRVPQHIPDHGPAFPVNRSEKRSASPS